MFQIFLQHVPKSEIIAMAIVFVVIAIGIIYIYNHLKKGEKKFDQKSEN